MEKQLSPALHQDMQAIAANLPTKSAKIRALGGAGYERADIARFLGIRYQHVRNVLVQAVGKKQQEAREVASEGCEIREWAQVGADGRVLIPMPVRQRMGLENGGKVLMEFEDGALRLTNRCETIRGIQEMVAEYVPEDVSLVDQLLAERRREVEMERDSD